jgi:hypothetical protein
MKNALGKIEPVSLLDLWSSESDAFTPWLAEPENIGLLARAVNLDLEVCEQESPVGAFCADILCKDRLSGNLVVVENQLYSRA